MHALLGYYASAATAGAANYDLSAITDPDFTTQNSHYVFTEPYKLLGAAVLETSFTKARFQLPTWNAVGEFDIMQGNLGIVPSAPPKVEWYGDQGPMLSLNEQLQFQVSNNLGASTEASYGLIWLGTAGTQPWNRNLPKGLLTFTTVATFTVTPTAGQWSGGQALTFATSLRGGTYSVLHAELQGDKDVAFRMIFPRYQLYNGRKLRPGWISQKAVGDQLSVLSQTNLSPLGEWGRFFTFEPPTVEVLGSTASSTTYTLFLRVAYLGTDPNLLGYGAQSI